MAIVDVDIPVQGSVGSYTFKHYKDKVVVCQKIGKHKKPLSEAQARDNYLMRNTMAMFSLLKGSLMDFLEDCPDLGKASNWYVRFNKHRCQAYLTAEERSRGACVVEGHQVSFGSLPEIGHRLTPEGRLLTDIRIGNEIGAETTVGELSADIVEHNPAFAEGDRLGLVYVRQNQDTEGLPKASCHVVEMVMDRSDGKLVDSLAGEVRWARCAAGDGTVLGLSRPLEREAACFVHVRNAAPRRFRVSTQRLLCVNDLADDYHWEQRRALLLSCRSGNDAGK